MNTNQSVLTYSSDDRYVPEVWDNDYAVQDDPHCYVCGRHTDHFAEHDNLVEDGFATYGDDGSVYRTEAWDADAVTASNQAAWAVYQTLMAERWE